MRAEGFRPPLPVFCGIEDLAATMRTSGLMGKAELVTTGAQQEARSSADGRRRIVSVDKRFFFWSFDSDAIAAGVFYVNLEQTIIERIARSRPYLAEMLA
jgi:hypothetical protein